MLVTAIIIQTIFRIYIFDIILYITMRLKAIYVIFLLRYLKFFEIYINIRFRLYVLIKNKYSENVLNITLLKNLI